MGGVSYLVGHHGAANGEAIPAVLGVLEYVDEGDRVVLEALAGDIAFTLPFKLYGNPAMSMPLHWQKDFLWGAVLPFGDDSFVWRFSSGRN